MQLSVESKHVPVLLAETMAALCVKAGGRYVDGTLGRAGHTKAILSQGASVLGIDRDDQALDEVRALTLGGLVAKKGRHGDLAEIARSAGWEQVDGILLDLGVSSPQLDEAERGFSFLRDGPLDMRMDRADGLTAADLVNRESAERLEEIFFTWGEEPRARQIAQAICKARGKVRFERTLQLADFVEQLLGRRGGHHPATRVFQALRMEVNREMDELERALAGGLGILKPGGRFAVITFESLTDRVVKRFFASHVGKMRSLQQGGEAWEGELPRCHAVTKKAVVAQACEMAENPRSRSAKLRVVERSDEV